MLILRLFPTAIISLCLTFSAARAETIIDQWADVKAPPAPALVDVSLDAKTSALLVLDFTSGICTPARAAVCDRALPAVETLIAAARAKNMLVVYTGAGTAPASTVLPRVKAGPDDPYFASSTDKFYNTDLEKTLRDKGIKSVVVTGVAANGAVLFTAAGAVRRGFDVAVVVDGAASDTAYAEQFTAWQLANGPGTTGKVKLTLSKRVTMQ